jgi:hypothetical protein
MKSKYVIGTGWWCNESDTKFDTDDRVVYGDDDIRSSLFQEKWIESVTKNCSPEKIIIVDSNSPTPPPNIAFGNVEYLKLNVNAGHSSNHTGDLCGWSRGMIMSAMYALNCDCEYYVYVEQDVLLKGRGIVEHAISTMTSPYMFGFNKGGNQPLQQSFFIIKRDHLSKFISRFLMLNYRDDEIGAEIKFALCCSPFFSVIPKGLFKKILPGTLVGKISYRLQVMISSIMAIYTPLPFGSGRDRPLVFIDKYLYFQHASKEELIEYEKLS